MLAARGAELRKAGALREAVRAKQAAAEQVSNSALLSRLSNPPGHHASC